MRRQHRPRRTCLGCGARDDKEVLVRLVLSESGEFHLDELGRGRGGYLHKAEECWNAFLRKKGLFRAFRREARREAREKLVLILKNRFLE